MELWKYLPDYAAWTIHDYGLHLLWGFIGGLVRLSYSNAVIRKWEWTEAGNLKLNAVGEMFVSMIFGMLANTNPLVSIFAAVLAPVIIEETVAVSREGIRFRIRRWLGLEHGLDINLSKSDSDDSVG